jgi:hypothetical protein
MSNNLKTMISAIFATTMVMTCTNAKADCCQGDRDTKAIVSPDRNSTLFDCEADPCKTPPLKKTCKCKCKGCIDRADEPRLPRPKPMPRPKYPDPRPKPERPRFDPLWDLSSPRK